MIKKKIHLSGNGSYVRGGYWSLWEVQEKEKSKKREKKKTFTDHYWLGVEKKESTKKERGGLESASSFWRRGMFQFRTVMFMVPLPFLFPSSHTVCNIKTKVKNSNFSFYCFKKLIFIAFSFSKTLYSYSFACTPPCCRHAPLQNTHHTRLSITSWAKP